MPLPEPRRALLWTGVIALMTIPMVLAADSPLLAYRQAPYIAAGFGGIAALVLMLVQPLLGARILEGGIIWHRIVGTAILGALAVHIGGLYLTSPQDTLDALLLVSPTPFSVYGVGAMTAMLLTALLVTQRRRLGLRRWRRMHRVLGIVVLAGSIVHVLLITGTMEFYTKVLMCICITLAGLYTLVLRPLRQATNRRKI
ncbi:MAG: ferric reductase [Sulfitobacter sp.]